MSNKIGITIGAAVFAASAWLAPAEAAGVKIGVLTCNVDSGYTKGGVLIWDVLASSSDMKAGALEGGYGGVSASATVGVGVGANVLLGGFDKSIALQPISIEGNTGLNVAGGIGALSLKFDKG